MSMSSLRRAILLTSLPLACAALADQGPRLGEALTADEIAAIDYVVLPDGSGLPPGSGTARQGAGVYARHCLSCHGEEGQGGTSDVLAGGRGTMTEATPVKTVGSYWPYATTVFDYIRRAMPYQEPGVLDNEENYAVTAFLLYINDIIGIDEPVSAKTLPEIDMPNRGNFVWAYTPRLEAGDEAGTRN